MKQLITIIIIFFILFLQTILFELEWIYYSLPRTILVIILMLVTAYIGFFIIKTQSTKKS
jgi:hypothetical protein